MATADAAPQEVYAPKGSLDSNYEKE